MAAVNNDNTVGLYSKLIANFGAAYAATQESVKTQGTTIASMQTQLQAMHQYCMGLQQQPPPTIYAPQQQTWGGRGYGRRTQSTGGSGGGGYQAPLTTGHQATPPPAPFKRHKNWNYYHTHSGDIAIAHTSQTCRWPGSNQNRMAMRMNTQAGSPAGLHKVILPLAAGRAPTPQQQQRAPTQAMWPQHPHPATYTAAMTTMRPTMPAAPYQQAIYHVGQQMGPQAM
jgi:hypothetical protein